MPPGMREAMPGGGAWRLLLFAAAGCMLLAAPALAGGGGKGWAGGEVKPDHHVRFPSGTGPDGAASKLAVHVGGRLTGSTMVQHPATETGWGVRAVPLPAGAQGGAIGTTRK